MATRMSENIVSQHGIYAGYIKRILDFLLSLLALLILMPCMLILSIVGAMAMKGNPFFIQPRPGKEEKIFYMVKFRTMSNAKDKLGKLLPDDERLNAYGKFLRSTSLDELPELWNIVKGDMAIVGPRPQLVRDMIFMTPEQRKRHSVRQGLTGLAQVNGRNNMSWEQKLEWDKKYIDKGITFIGDVKIILKTIGKVLKRSDVSTEGMETAEDFGDYLLRIGKVSQEEYVKFQEEAQRIMGDK